MLAAPGPRKEGKMQQLPTVGVAVLQAAPVLFQREASTDKACSLLAEAGRQGARLILFPEAFVPGYPRGLIFGNYVGGRTPEGRLTWQAYWENAVEIPSTSTAALGKAAREANAYVAIGVVERVGTYSGGTLYCTLLYSAPDGSLVGKHRKLKPTGTERVIWGERDGSTLTVVETEFGIIGGLICWENYMPLARTAMYGKGVGLYLAPTADFHDTWHSTLRHIALEGRCFVLGCNQFMTKDMYPAGFPGLDELQQLPHMLSRGGSAIVSPLGKVLAGPLYDQEGTLFADLDLSDVARSKIDFDVVGHYARPDIFQLTVDERPKPPIRYQQAGGA
jgi:nitrilase